MYETPETPQDVSESPYPWAAVVAVAVAASIVGTLFGYLYGYSRGTRATDATPAEFAAGMTEAEVVEPDAETEMPAGDITRAPLAEADAAPPPPPPASAGQFIIRSEPDGALVTIDGRLEGSTPITVTDVAFGDHVVQVARPGYAPHVETMSLSASMAERTLSVRLEAGAEAAPVTRGAVVFDSRPQGANVWLDGRLAGATPLRLASTAIGEHAVRFELAGYRTVSTTVTVVPDQEARVAVTLQPARRPQGRGPDMRQER